MLAIYRGSSADLRYALKLVIQSPQIDSGIVPRDGHMGYFYQLIPFISRAAQFFQSIGIVWKGTQLILGIHHPTLGG